MMSLLTLSSLLSYTNKRPNSQIAKNETVIFEIWTHNPSILHVVLHDHTGEVITLSPPILSSQATTLLSWEESELQRSCGRHAGGESAGARKEVSRERRPTEKSMFALASLRYTQR